MIKIELKACKKNALINVLVTVQHIFNVDLIGIKRQLFKQKNADCICLKDVESCGAV